MTVKVALLALLYFLISAALEVSAETADNYHGPKEKKSLEKTYDGFAFTDPTSVVVAEHNDEEVQLICGQSAQTGLFADTNPKPAGPKEGDDSPDEIPMRAPANKDVDSRFNQKGKGKVANFYPCRQ